MSILALDLGTTTGHAQQHGGAVMHGFINLKGGRYEGGGMRFVRFRRFLEETHRATPVSTVYFEEVRRHAGTDAAHIYGGLMATLTAWCEEHEIPYEGVPVGTIKKHATGKGNADKEMVADAVRAAGFEVVDYNEADAIALLRCKLDEIERARAG